MIKREIVVNLRSFTFNHVSFFRLNIYLIIQCFAIIFHGIQLERNFLFRVVLCVCKTGHVFEVEGKTSKQMLIIRIDLCVEEWLIRAILFIFTSQTGKNTNIDLILTTHLRCSCRSSSIHHQ